MAISEKDFEWQQCPVAGTDLAKRMLGSTWRSDAPVPLQELCLLKVSHVGFQGSVLQGEIIVHQTIVPLALGVFESLYKARFPIEKIRLLHHYDGDDEASMSDNNSSAFNARPLTGQSSGWSKHSYGIAIDINPVQNPYVMRDGCLPPEGEVFIDREVEHPGLIRPGNVCHKAFMDRGFEWGGDWTHVRDYHHFELPLSTIGYAKS